MGTAFARALRETLRCRRLPAVLILGTLLAVVGSSAATGVWQVFSIAAMLLTAGYSVSYTREVALSDTPSLPAPGQVGVFLRRGVGDFVIVFVAVLLLIPLLFVVGLATTSIPLAWPWLAPAFGIVMSLLLFPALARYAYTDRLREGIRILRSAQQVSRVGAIALTPVLVLLASTTVQQLVRLAWRKAFDVPQTSWLQALGNVVAGSAQVADAWLLALSVLLAAFGFFAGLLMSHSLGQVAKVAFYQEGREVVALTSASS